jgi:hypothetical protein
MIRTIIVGSVLLALSVAGCSTRQWYEGIQAGQRNDCQKYPDAERRKCLDAASIGYDDYQRERDQAAKK